MGYYDLLKSRGHGALFSKQSNFVLCECASDVDANPGITWHACFRAFSVATEFIINPMFPEAASSSIFQMIARDLSLAYVTLL